MDTQMDKDKYNLQFEVLDGNTYLLTDGNKVYVCMFSLGGPLSIRSLLCSEIWFKTNIEANSINNL